MSTKDAVGTPSPLRGEVGAQRRVRGGVLRARSLRKDPTDAEARLWSKLRNRQLSGHKFVRQFSIGRYVADFVCKECALVVEVDGGQHSESASDDARTEFLNREGYGVLRFWNNDVMSNTAGVLEAIAAVLDRHPSPGWRYSPADLSPEGRGVRGAHAATAKQRSGYLDFLKRVGDAQQSTNPAVGTPSPLRGEVGAQRRVRGGVLRARTTLGEQEE